MLKNGRYGRHGSIFTAAPICQKAQATKDATMAYFIYKNWKKRKADSSLTTALIIPTNYEGIVWYLQRVKIDLKIVTSPL